MRVARYHRNSSVRVEAVPRPRIEAGEVLVRVLACGICGSDVAEWFRLPKAPRILGHELSGVVAESRAAGWAEGDRVVVRNQVPCQQCHACRHDHHAVCEQQAEITPGGMAEFVRVPAAVAARGLTPLPAALSYPVGTLAEPVACVLRAQALARVRPHQTLVVYGLGVFGLLHLQVARAAGVSRIVAVDGVAARRAAAASLGATVVLDPGADIAAEVRAVNEGRLADVAVVATGAPAALASASDALARWGTVLLFGAPPPDVPVPVTLNQLFWRRELTMVSSYGAGGVDLADALALIEKGAVDGDAMISHVIPLVEVQGAFDVVTAAGDSRKVVLDLS